MNSEPSSTPDLEAEDSGKISASRPHGHHHHHDLGMKAVLIHVLGDALNNIGVIIAGVLIWKSNSSKRFYADPAMSLVIGVMLILTALNLGMDKVSSIDWIADSVLSSHTWWSNPDAERARGRRHGRHQI
jgi:hypothetical protein